MPMVRGMRMLNAVEAGTLSGAELETLLTTDPGRLAELNMLLGMRGQTRRMSASSIAMAAVAVSSTAMAAIAKSSTAMAAVTASSTAMTVIIASSTAMAAVVASSSAMTVITASSTAMAVIAESSTAMAAIAASSTAMAAVADSPSALETVIGIPSALETVIGSAAAMATVIASSTAMATIVASSTAMAAIAASATARLAIYNSDTALSAISASTTAINALTSSPQYQTKTNLQLDTVTRSMGLSGKAILLKVSQSWSSTQPSQDCVIEGLRSNTTISGTRSIGIPPNGIYAAVPTPQVTWVLPAESNATYTNTYGNLSNTLHVGFIYV